MPAANRMRSGFVAGRAPVPSRPLGARTAIGVGGSRSLRPQSAAVLRRRQVQKRRRDVFFALLAGVVGSFALALIPGLQVMWFIQVIFDLVFVAYVALLLRLRNLAAERELKLTFLSQGPVRGGPSRGSGYALAGYDDLTLRRTAN
jgi:hypothetical protein